MSEIGRDIDIAVLIPCFNEEAAVAHVVEAFRRSLPSARIHVFDNGSADRTAEVARQAGAMVSRVTARGKGNVVRRMFADVEADLYVLVDGDDTYDAGRVGAMIDLLLANKLDMVVGTRVSGEQASYRPGHRFGNALLTGMVSVIFGRAFTDILSGYRVFSRRFVKSFPAISGGFEIETELSVHALQLMMPCGEMQTTYRARKEGSVSKLSTFGDGRRILGVILQLLRLELPLRFFLGIAAILALVSIGIFIPVLMAYLETGLVERLPTALLSTGLMILAALSAMCGIILDNVTRGRRETRHLFYLTQPPPGQSRNR